ncbi:MAG: cysteine synthase A [Clostridia bacterium]|nr:cysteine synthase A [Clostridia bacterium]
MLVRSVADLIGKTPLLAASNLAAEYDLCATLLLKVESVNPAGSVKDRVALEMIRDAEERGVLKAGGTISEPTSGNTGIGLAAIAAAKGYRLIITMPDTMSVERRKLIAAYGAELVLTDGARGMAGAIEKANELAAVIDGAIVAGQFENPANPAAHYKTTGPEIFDDTAGAVDMFVAGVGTGGTITGVGRYLKERKPSVQVVAVEPADSPVLSGGKAGAHGLQGIGAGFVPDVLDTTVYDAVVPVTTVEAYEAARSLAKTEGILVGISSGAALHAALQLAADRANAGKTIVALLPDTGDRYLSTALYE